MEDSKLPPIPGQDSPQAEPTKKGGDPLAAAKEKFQELLAKQKASPDLQKPLRKNGPKEEDEAEEPEAKDEKKKPAELTGLRQRLVLAGFPRELVEPLSDSKVDEVWKKQEERERTAETALRRASELEKQLASKDTSKQSEPQAGVPTDELDLDELASDLSAQFGEDESKAIAKTLSKSVEPLLAKLSRLEAIIESARKSGEEQAVKTQRARLSEKLPMLKGNDTAWNTIEAAVRANVEKQSSKYSSVEAAFDDVFDGLFGELLAEKAKEPEPAEDKTKEQKARISASANPAPASSKKSREHGPEDAHRAALQHLIKNPDDVEGARRAYGRFTVQ